MSALKGDGEGYSPPEEEKVTGLVVEHGHFLEGFLPLKHRFQLVGKGEELVAEGFFLFGGYLSLHLAQVNGEKIEDGQLPHEGLGGSDADLGAGFELEYVIDFPGYRGADDVGHRKAPGSPRLSDPLGREGVGGFSRLGNEDGEGIGTYGYVPIAVFRGDIDPYVEVCYLLEEPFSNEGGIV